MNRLFLLIVASALPLLAHSTDQIMPIPRSKYIEFARASADWTWEHKDSLENAWREKYQASTIWGFRPPSRFLEMATIYATLYDMEGVKIYADRAKEILLAFDKYRVEYPKEAIRHRPDYSNGVPALPDFFTAMRYVKTYELLKKHD